MDAVLAVSVHQCQRLMGNLIVPGPGGVDVIYRTIDLEDPFPGQAADKRNTGSNWCSYSNGVYSCKYDNLTVKNYITREEKQRVKKMVQRYIVIVMFYMRLS